MGERALAVAGSHEKTALAAQESPDAERLRRLVAHHFDFIWRSLRRLGVPARDTDDAAQHVFMVAARKIGPVSVEGERAFLFQVALRIAADDRRTRRRHPDANCEKDLPDVPESAPGPDELVDRQKARSVLDAIVAGLPLELRVAFVLFELEEMTVAEIAGLLDLPQGTVASRLRRSRELFESAVNRYRARSKRGMEK
jgi:RNA polymerase sigma-70 factor (ECF subfamily)